MVCRQRVEYVVVSIFRKISVEFPKFGFVTRMIRVVSAG